MKNSDLFTLANGVKIPAIGFGTWQIPPGDITYDSVAEALKAGYRHIDTAQAYGNEASVGKAVIDSGLARDEIFVTSKLPAEIKSYKKAVRHIRQTMKNIRLDYIDLYLIHAPWPWEKMGADYTSENIEVWKAMEEFYESGQTRSIGISNFNIRDTEAILANCRIKPMVNQIKLHIGFWQKKLVEFCNANEILAEAYSPLATGKILQREEIVRVAESCDKTPAQIAIRYLLQKGTLPLPKSVHPQYISENFDINFEIPAEEMALLDSLTPGI